MCRALLSLAHPRITNRLVVEVCRARLQGAGEYAAFRRACALVFDGTAAAMGVLHDRLRYTRMHECAGAMCGLLHRRRHCDAGVRVVATARRHRVAAVAGG